MNRSLGSAASSRARQAAAWVPVLARTGYAAKGVVYGLVGAIAIQAGLSSGTPEGSTGALQELGQQRGGEIMLMLMAAGLACHVVWRLVQAALDPEHRHQRTDGKRIGARLFALLSAVIYGSLALTAWQLARGQGDAGGDEGATTLVGKLLQQPFGTWLVMLAGIGVIGYGLQQLYKAWKGNVTKRMVATNVELSRGMVMVGRIGTAARGVVLVPVGWFIFSAGRHYRAEQTASTADVLDMFGPGWLLAAVGAGLFAYGLHQLAKALYRRIGQPA